ncbi:hypothetical protein [Paraburkholderia tropica]|uniref:hypothetical protein n=1 Tax=Paraburkholderia tropica TaxID=92647 RepID=UPI002AB21E88|nr:hypothetical protein [Paraburkholderia tropica]
MTTDSTPAQEPKPQYWEMIRNIARQVTSEEAHDDAVSEGTAAERLTSAMAELCEIPFAKIQQDVFEERVKLLENEQQDFEDQYGGLNQDGSYPHEV